MRERGEWGAVVVVVRFVGVCAFVWLIICLFVCLVSCLFVLLFVGFVGWLLFVCFVCLFVTRRAGA